MADNILETKFPGDVVDANDPNQYKQALGEDIVPRNVDGEPTNEAGSLGTPLLVWLAAYINEVFFGDPSEGVKIVNGGGILNIVVDGNVCAQFGDRGDGTYGILNPSTIRSVLLTSSSVEFSANQFFVEAVGGGGAGGAGDSSPDIDGAQGGDGSVPKIDFIESSALPTALKRFTRGAGGVASGSLGGNGGNGGDTILEGWDDVGMTWVEMFRVSGAAGGLGANGASTIEKSRVLTPTHFNTKGGRGGDGTTAGTNGERTTKWIGGPANQTDLVSGGGGGAGMGPGGRGAWYVDATNNGVSFAGGLGAGGGAGRGSSTVDISKEGSNGGNGAMRIIYVDDQELVIS